MNWLVTGGAGFIGTNMAYSLLERGENITIFDNFSRVGSNKSFVKSHPECKVIEGDISKRSDIESAVSSTSPDIILHLAAQVAVTFSINDPRHDFECNALGTLNLLEAARKYSPDAILLNASTNKVYGKMENIPIVEHSDHYTYGNNAACVSEEFALDFYSPYGCSKGAAEQYVIDYARIYGIRSVNLRQSCIYGPHQFGIEDQGWVAWLTIAAVTRKPITIYGSGKQVRDILYVDDLIEVYFKAIENIDEVSGKTFNIGGGRANTISLLQLIDSLKTLSKRHVEYGFDQERPGDQKVYISDISKAEKLLNWKPRVTTGEGVEKLFEWVSNNKELFLTGIAAYSSNT